MFDFSDFPRQNPRSGREAGGSLAPGQERSHHSPWCPIPLPEPGPPLLEPLQRMACLPKAERRWLWRKVPGLPTVRDKHLPQWLGWELGRGPRGGNLYGCWWSQPPSLGLLTATLLICKQTFQKSTEINWNQPTTKTYTQTNTILSKNGIYLQERHFSESYNEEQSF